MKRTVKLSESDWNRIGQEAGWLEKEAATSMNPYQYSNFLQQIQTNEQFAQTLYQHMGQLSTSLEADLMAMKDMAISSPRITRISDMMTRVKDEIDRSIPDVQALRTEVEDQRIGEMTTEESYSFQQGTEVSTGISNTPVMGAPGVEAI